MGRERGFCWTPPFSRGLEEMLAVCSFIHSFQNLGMTSLRGVCMLVGGVCFQCMVKWRAMNVSWRKGKNSEGFWFPADDTELFIPNEMPVADQGLKVLPFLTQESVTLAFEKWVKKIHVWACARWFCCLYCGCVFLPMFGLSSALLHKCFWLLCKGFWF